MKYNDFLVARNALYNMLTLKPERAGLKDTLTYLYYNTNSYVQVILLGEEIIKEAPSKAEILELVAVSQQNLGMMKEALESFEKLYAISKDVYHQYNIASLQYMLKRYGECNATLQSILESADTEGVVAISDGKNESQQVPVKAAAYNMLGVISLEINQPEAAKQHFQQAIKLFPEFILAKNNLDKVNATGKKAPEKK
jgi:tetratricopeptide (TPR) repeat protein